MAANRGKSVFKWFCALMIVLFLAASAGLLIGYRWYDKQLDLEMPGADGTFFLVPEGASISQVADLLEREGIVGSAFLFRLHMRIRHPESSIKAGEYLFESPVTTRKTALKLVRGDVYYHRITIPEGLDWQETAALLGRQGFGSGEEFLEIISDPGLIRSLDPEADNLEGYLFPETYHVTRETTPEEIVSMMVSRFRAHWTDEWDQRAKALGMSVREIVTLASMIEKETALAEERPLVSSVFHNRLAENMKLACDPTVIYAVKRVKPWDGIIHQSDLQIDSPYNTYLYPGLPPGPIASPGLASIRAALYPAETMLRFFVSRNDGSHVFSDSYSEHAAAVRKYQR